KDVLHAGPTRCWPRSSKKDKVGGTCLHRGYIPAKALLHAAEIADHAHEAGSFGVRARFEAIDMAGVNACRARWSTGSGRGLQSTIAWSTSSHRSSSGRIRG